MHEGSVVISRPQAPSQLVLVFHGVGSCAADLVPLGEAIAAARPGAAVVSVEAPHPSRLGRGKEWFSVVGITEQSRPARIADAMPLFLQAIGHWQQLFGVGTADTVLLGFSQGAIMALEATQALPPAAQAAHTVVALAGRFAQPARQAPSSLRFHLIHGEADGVVPTSCSVAARIELQGLSADVTLDLVPRLGHGIDARVLGHVVDRLSQR